MSDKYIKRDEVIDGVPMKSVYASDGSYICDYGLEPGLLAFIDKHGIKPERRLPTSNVASVGFSGKANEWFGWSHRAIKSFPTREEAARFAESVS